MKSIFSFLYFILIFMLPFASLGQFKSRTSPIKMRELLSVYGATGFTNYYGDLCDNYSCAHLRPNIGAGFIYRLSDKISSRTELNYLRLYSKDVWPDRNLSFRSGNVELYTSVMYDYYAFTKHMSDRKRFSPYVFAGLGFTFYNPRGEYNGKWYSLRPLKTEGKHYGIITPIIPIGLGIKIKYTRQWDFLAELGYRITFTDHLDDVSSHKFLPINSFSNSKAAELSNKTKEGDAFKGYRGDPKKNDGYFVLSFKARYTFTSKNVYKNTYKKFHKRH